MEYRYDINHSIQDNASKNSLFCCHSITSIINIFISTFLIAHIYFFSGDIYDYIYKVCIYNLAHYLTMAISYFVLAWIVERSNRIIIYRISLIIRLLLVILFIFYGKELAQILVLAGLIRGLSDSFYYASYNVLKQEMVSRKIMSRYASNIYIVAKIIDVICPVILGTLINIADYSSVAIVIGIIGLIQIVISFFIKSKRPVNSEYNLKKYFTSIKQSPQAYKKLKFIYLLSGLYTATLIKVVLNICIMSEFKSTVDLGIITSVLSCVSVITIFVVRKLTKAGHRTWLFVVSAICLMLASIMAGVYMTKWTIIIYNTALAIGSIIFKMNYDTYRNGILKEAGLYEQIAEHHTVMETIYNIVRVAGFALALLISFTKHLVLFKLYFVAISVMYAIAFILLGVYEQNYLRCNQEEK